MDIKQHLFWWSILLLRHNAVLSNSIASDRWCLDAVGLSVFLLAPGSEVSLPSIWGFTIFQMGGYHYHSTIGRSCGPREFNFSRSSAYWCWLPDPTAPVSMVRSFPEASLRFPCHSLSIPGILSGQSNIHRKNVPFLLLNLLLSCFIFCLSPQDHYQESFPLHSC